MIIIEMNKEDRVYADKIAELAEMSIIVDQPRAFSSDLNEIVQVGVQLAPYIVPSVSLIIVEMIKNAKKVKIKLSDESIEVEGMSKDEAIEIVEKYIKEKREDKAQEILNKLLNEG